MHGTTIKIYHHTLFQALGYTPIFMKIMFTLFIPFYFIMNNNSNNFQLSSIENCYYYSYLCKLIRFFRSLNAGHIHNMMILSTSFFFLVQVLV